MPMQPGPQWFDTVQPACVWMNLLKRLARAHNALELLPRGFIDSRNP